MRFRSLDAADRPLRPLTREEIAEQVVRASECQWGETVVLSRTPEELCELIEIRPEIGTWMAYMATISPLSQAAWPHISAMLDARAAQRAIERALAQAAAEEGSGACA